MHPCSDATRHWIRKPELAIGGGRRGVGQPPRGPSRATGPRDRCTEVPSTRYQVFLSSTFNDLQAERDAVIKQLLQMTCIPAGMELFPASARPPWDLITKGIDASDYFVLIIGGRYGSISANTSTSYTEREYDYAVDHDVPVLAFIHPKPEELAAKNVDQDSGLVRQLDAFRNRIRGIHTVHEWSNASQLALDVSNALLAAYADQPRPGWIRGSDERSAQTSNQAAPDQRVNVDHALRKVAIQLG